MNDPSGAAILRDLPVQNNLQKSGDLHCKVDRQNSFVLYANNKRGGPSNFQSSKLGSQ